MPRRKESFEVGEHYHIFNRGVDRQPVFFSRENYLFFLRRMGQYLCGINPPEWNESLQETRSCQILAYCLMPNHYHLLVQICAETFSASMQSLSQSYTNAINRERERVGPLFQGRFCGKHIDDELGLLHVSRYIHRNPVDAGLVKLPHEWEFSSDLDYTGVRHGRLPNQSSVLTIAGGRERYRRFVEDKEGHPPVSIDNYLFKE